VASPEGCAAILWGDAARAPEAAEHLKLTSEDLVRFGIVDRIVSEPLGGAHRDPGGFVTRVLGSFDAELAAVLGGTQSLHTNSYDEALALPSAKAARLALRTQQVLAFETDVPATVDPFAGSYAVEKLTDAVEEADPALRNRRLAAWEEAPDALACHPESEHLLPLMVVAGAAGSDRGETPCKVLWEQLRVASLSAGGDAFRLRCGDAGLAAEIESLALPLELPGATPATFFTASA